MKLKGYIFFITYFILQNVNGQVTKESFYKCVDYLNCTSVQLSLKSASKTSYEAFRKVCDCETASYSKINKELEPLKIKKTRDLSNQIQEIKKNEYDSSLTQQDVIEYLTNGVFQDKKYSDVVDFYTKRKDSIKLIYEFKQKLEKYFNANIVEIEAKISDTTPSPDVNGDEETINSNPSNVDTNMNQNIFLDNTENIFFVLAISLIVSSIISLLFSIYNKKQTKEEILLRIKKELSKIESTNTFSSNTNSNLHIDELRRLQNKIAEVEKKLLTFDQELINNKTSSNQGEGILLYSKQSIDASPETFFLSAPNIDGTFDRSSSSPTYRPGATIYKFTSIGNNKAKFRISEVDASIKLALQYQDKTIDPVCDNLNAYDPQSTKIVTVSEGEAELHGEKWVCNIKAKIRYEN